MPEFLCFRQVSAASGIDAFIVAQTNEAYAVRVTSAILLSTAASFVSVGLLVAHFRATLAE